MIHTPARTMMLWIRGLASKERETLLDRDLLLRYLKQRDQAAFTALVERHGPMVLNVCQAALGHRHDAEDAFQATFLVLARQASSIRRLDSLASWLHGVACRVARKAQVAGARRQALHAKAPAAAPVMPANDLHWGEVQTILHEELAALPERFRQALVACYLEGLTQQEAARQLNWSPGTVKGRLQRGRDLLRGRLERRGLGLSAALGASVLTGQALAAPLPPSLAKAAVQAVFPAPGTSAPAVAVSLARSMESPLVTARFLVTACAVVLVVIAVGAFHWSQQPLDQDLPTAKAEAGDPRGAQRATPLASPAAQADDRAKDGSYFIFRIQTDLQRALAPTNADVLVLFDTTAALDGGKVVLTEQKLSELHKALLPYKKADSKLHFLLFSERFDGAEENVLRLALIGLGHEVGFSKVTARGGFTNGNMSWKETCATFTDKPRQPKGDEAVKANDYVKAYAVRTELSRYLTSDSDCAVIILPSLEKAHGVIPKKVRDAVIDAVGQLKLTNQKQISFYLCVHSKLTTQESKHLHGELTKLAEEMKFGANSVTIRGNPASDKEID